MLSCCPKSPTLTLFKILFERMLIWFYFVVPETPFQAALMMFMKKLKVAQWNREAYLGGWVV